MVSDLMISYDNFDRLSDGLGKLMASGLMISYEANITNQSRTAG